MGNYNILHVHSQYSIHDSVLSPEEIVEKAVEIGCKNITLTDHGTLLGIDDFMDAGQKARINTIPGVELYLENRLHLVVIAKNYAGFKVISRVLRDANEHQEIRKIKGRTFVYPIVTKEILESMRGDENIIVTSACIQGPVAVPLLKRFYTNEKNNQIKEKMKLLEHDVEQYKLLQKKIKELDRQLKSFRTDKSEFIKYTKAPYQRQIEVNIKNAGKYVEQIQELEESGSESELLNGKRIELNELNLKIVNMKELRDNAIQMVQYLEVQIIELKSKKKDYMTKRDSYKNQKNRYEKLKEKLTSNTEYTHEYMYEQARETALYFNTLFPNFYLEVQNHGLRQEAVVMPDLVKISHEIGIPLIAANDAHMKDSSQESITARQIVRYNYFDKHQEVTDTDRELYIKTEKELYHALAQVISEKDAQTAIDNTKVLETCHVEFPTEKHYPSCESDQTFTELLETARQNKISDGEWDEEHEKRLRHEMKIIQTMGFVDYHMVVRDFCIAGRKLGVVPKRKLVNMPSTYKDALEWIKFKGYNTGVGVGPGRGSAVGSLVCYLLGITNIDPLKYNLLFERFLNPERVTMPDIDTDIKTSLRPYIIRYCKERYGYRTVSSIVTISTYAAKASIQMVGRDRADELYGNLPKDEQKIKKQEYLIFTRKISNLLPDGSGIKLSAYDELFYSKYETNSEAILLWERAKLIEGRANGTGIHAGGIVISDNDDINEYLPVMWKEDMQVWATQCDMVRVEKKGMLKMDILGLLFLDCISDTVNMIKDNYGISIDLDHIPHDKEVFREIYAKGNTNSIFQVESAGMKKMMRDFEPESFEDIILLISMYRPGPMQFISDIIDVKKGKKEVVYKTPLLEPILKDTYGAIAYQEQVLQLFQVLAGYSLGQADLVRRAMSKKKTDKLKIERNAFVFGDTERGITGCVSNGIQAEVANEIFDEVEDFAKYAFNKSHAAAYAVVSYQAAWLKYYYPKEFLCSMFNNKELEQYEPIVEDCMRLGIELLPPDINISIYDFQTENEKIRYGFRGIKGVADENIIEEFVRSRKAKDFMSFGDFLDRFTEESGNACKLAAKKIILPLIRTGCFDCIAPDRIALDSDFENMLLNQPKSNLISFFNEQHYQEIKNVSKRQEWEIEYMGRCISSNPLKIYKDDTYYGCIPYSGLENGKATVFGLLSAYETKISNAGNNLLLVHLIGKTGKITIMFLKDKFTYYEKIIGEYENNVVRINGVYKDGILFGKRMERMEAQKKVYTYVCDTEEKYQDLLCIAAPEGMSDGIEELNIFTFYTKQDGKILRLETPKMFRMLVSKYNALKLGCKALM